MAVHYPAQSFLFGVAKTQTPGVHRRSRRDDGSKADANCALEYDEFCHALDKLPPEQREALVLIGASGQSYEDAAQICGCPTGTMKSRVHRARSDLAQLLAIEGPEYFEEDPIISAVMARSARAGIGA
jgi:DNA-directed RNA polymerase specialized sigma24 family protein